MLPDYSSKERLADGVVHVAGVALSLAGTVFLLKIVLSTDDAPLILAGLIYGGGLLATFVFSAAYNLIRAPNLKEIVRRFDHAAIFVMIGGTYTPLALIGIGGGAGHRLAGVVWVIAGVGVILKLFWPRRFERTSLALYLGLGWIGVLAAEPMVENLTAPVLVLLVAGGVLYTTGVLFHLWEALPYHNAIWHAFVLVAAGCHYAAVLEMIELAHSAS